MGLSPTSRQARNGLITFVLLLLVLLIAAVHLNSLRARFILPTAARYIQTDAPSFAATSAIRPMWESLKNHIDVSQDDPDPINQAIGGIRDAFMDRCLSMSSLQDVSALGLDVDRGVAVSGMDIQFAGIDMDPNLVVLAVPIANREAFLNTVTRIFAPKMRVHLSAEVPKDGVVTWFEIDSLALSNARPCLGGTSKGGKPVSIIPSSAPFKIEQIKQNNRIASANLYLAPNARGFTIELTCTARLANGKAVPCECSVNGNSCDSSEPLKIPDRKLKITDVISADDAVEGMEMWADRDLYYLFTPDDYALIGVNPSRVLSTYRNREMQAVAISGDDGVLAGIDALEGKVKLGDGFVIGAVRSPGEFALRSAPFALHATGDRLALIAGVAVDTLESALLQKLIAAPGGDQRSYARKSNPLSMMIRDRYLGDYVQFVDSKLDGQLTEDFHKHLGNFVPLLEQLADFREIGPVHLDITGVRGGVPDLVLSIEGLSKADHGSIIYEQRVAMKLARDRQVLRGALNTFEEKREYPPKPFSAADLEPYLGAEADDLLRVYDVEKSDFPLRDGQEILHDTFDVSAYRLEVSDLAIGYIPPPFTDLDVKYRLQDREREGDIDVPALVADEFRMAFLHEAHADRLIIGMDATSVLEYASNPFSNTDVVDPNTKIQIRLQPSLLLAQFYLHPNKEVRRFAEDGFLSFFRQYRSGTLELTTPEQFDGLAVSVELHHD